MKKLIVIILLMSSSSACAYDMGQEMVLRAAYNEGQRIGFPETIQAICLQETIAGLIGPVGDLSKPIGLKSYGVMQIKVATAKDVIRWNRREFRYLKKNISDEEIMIKLIEDDLFNIQVGTMYFKYLYNRASKYKHRWSKAVLAYNRGFNGKGDPNDYVRKVQRHIKEVRLTNRLQ